MEIIVIQPNRGAKFWLILVNVLVNEMLSKAKIIIKSDYQITLKKISRIFK